MIENTSNDHKNTPSPKKKTEEKLFNYAQNPVYSWLFLHYGTGDCLLFLFCVVILSLLDCLPVIKLITAGKNTAVNNKICLPSLVYRAQIIRMTENRFYWHIRCIDFTIQFPVEQGSASASAESVPRYWWHVMICWNCSTCVKYLTWFNMRFIFGCFTMTKALRGQLRPK